MTTLTFHSSSRRSWFELRDGSQTVYVTGWAATGDKLLSGESLGRHITHNAVSCRAFNEVLCNSLFAALLIAGF